MRKKIAIVLTAVLVLCASFVVYGAEAGNLLTNGGQTQDMGQVDVSIGGALILGQDTEFTVKLTNAQNELVSSQKLSLGRDNAKAGRVSFERLAEGDYTVTVSGERFAQYVQKVSVKNGTAYAVNLTTGFLGGMNYEAGAAHPGVLIIGDVNGDGKTDAADKTELVNAIEAGAPAGLTDLNGDGVVDLVDLEYLAKGYEHGKDIAAAVDRFVPAAAITASQGKNTVMEGDPEALLRNQGSVTLKPAGGGAISDSSPVEMEFDVQGQAGTAPVDGIIIGTGGDNSITKATITVVYSEGGVDKTETLPFMEGVDFLLKDSASFRAEQDRDGSIRLHLGSQVAVKKVTLTIMGMKNNNLAEISKVEFVNGMEERIPEPEMDIPMNLTPSVGSNRISLSWDTCVNVTGYEVLICLGDKQETVLTAKNSVDITSFGGKKLENYQEYQLRVQSVNGTWRSGYGDVVTATPVPNGRPDKPDNVSAIGEYRSVIVSWKKMDDTLTYNLYWKESSSGEYTKIENISANSYTLTENLKDLTEYTVYVTGVNDFGESGPSLPAAARTKDSNPPVMPKYNLINVGEKGEKSAHIVNASMFGSMKDSPLDTEAGSAWGTVDHDPASYYLKGSWDDGGYNPVGAGLNAKNGLLYEFDQAYKMDTIAFYTQPLIPGEPDYSYVKAVYWDEGGQRVDLKNVPLQKKTDAEGRKYYVIKLPAAVTTNKLQFGLARALASGNVTVTEVYFYYYDELMDEIMGLYTDDLHTVLRPEVTQGTIDALRTKINTKDEVSGEYHPDRELLELELQTAEAILKDQKLKDPVEIHCGITTNDVGRGFGGLNAWQPLGVTAAAEEEIIVYVGHATKKTGEDAQMQLVATQYHSEASNMFTAVAGLKIGPNKVSIPKIWTTAGFESGGALYVQYTGGNLNDRYAVRVSGGVQVPRLDLYHVTDQAERLERTEAFVRELETYVAQMDQKHQEVHQNSGNSNIAMAYDERNCILGAGDILLDTMMLSLPLKQIWEGAGSGSADEKAARILSSMDAVEGMMDLFYQHKGLNENAAQALDQYPKGHLNIRYQRMFAKAFMYASGNHIGIEWPETAGMMGGIPVSSDSEGRYVSGRYFGWGIAHEIGHCINQGTYAVAEVTNNYFAVLAQAHDDDSTVRFQYKNVYEKVTSGAKGPAPNVFTQLGMYWQLHLAYDKGYNYKTYESHQDQLANLFFARVDSYSRDASKAPAPGGIALAKAGDRDQDLMRLCCAAAQKNILEFFERWGMTPNQETRSYAAQFPQETRAIYYASDNARVYSLANGSSALGEGGTVEAVGDGVSAAIDAVAGNQINITLGSKNIPGDSVLGYEITRCTISGGDVTKEAVGFVTADQNAFTDTVYMNNRALWYEVTVIDKWLNRSAAKVLEPLKVENDGCLDKSSWSVSAENLTAAEGTEGMGDENSPCEPEKEDPALKTIDGDVNTLYTATAGENAQIVLEFNRTLTVAGFKYTAAEGTAPGEYEIQVQTGGNWITPDFVRAAEGKVSAVYFRNDDGKYVSTYAATAVRLILKNQTGSQISIGELDVLGPTGDNVDFERTQESTPVIGRLTADYKYGEEEGQVIPAGSILFTGSYKGNPAYNVVIVYDQNGNIVGGLNDAGELKASQIILADIPEGDLQNVESGIWIYWIEPDQNIDLSGITKVRAELYRVNNALTNEGQRLVSDSLFEKVPETLPDISLDSNAGVQP